ncbi:MAG: 2Fe-2S iron-sulfur cluster-binding protein, partial [Kiloniellales bacterium]
MSGYRLAEGGLVDRQQALGFAFDGKRFSGLGGDTLASALLASGVTLFGRSFKYHRPRGVLSAGIEEPNALVTLREGARREPNSKATEVELFEGLSAESQHRWPSLAFDAMAVNGLFAPFIAAGFYYKTFMGPGRRAWMFYEHFIRKAAGLGSGSFAPDPDRYEKMHAFCDLLVVGGGPAGIAAALTAGKAGLRVILAEHDRDFGGALIGEQRSYAGTSAHERVQTALAELASLPRVTLLSRTMVYGYYDGNTLGAVERVCDHLPVPPSYSPRQRNWMIRAKRVVLATGAIERPLVFAGNDMPGVMLADAVKRYVARYAVSPGRKVALFANNDGAYRTLQTLSRAGVALAAAIDVRAEIGPQARAIAEATGVEILTGHAVVKASGGQA